MNVQTQDNAMDRLASEVFIIMCVKITFKKVVFKLV